MIEHRQAKIGEKTFLRVQRPMNNYSSPIYKGTVWLYCKYGYKLIAIEDTEYPMMTLIAQKYRWWPFGREILVPVIKREH